MNPPFPQTPPPSPRVHSGASRGEGTSVCMCFYWGYPSASPVGDAFTTLSNGELYAHVYGGNAKVRAGNIGVRDPGASRRWELTLRPLSVPTVAARYLVAANSMPVSVC